ncbi:MAG: sugar ABC transporter substrate-binding protein [Cyclobacteriaceae bacterium]|nr:sugar ABC transporter substrate-binding protein [Cyclobacteriaceae bacterium]
MEIIELTGTPTEQYDKLTVMLTAGQNIDGVVMWSDDSYDRFVSLGFLEPLNDYIKKDSINLDPIKGLIEKASRKGTIYALPFQNSVWVTYYNKNIFDAAGVPYPMIIGPGKNIRRLQRNLPAGRAQKKFGVPYTLTGTRQWAAIASQEGVSYYKEDGTPNVDHPAFLKYFKMRYQMTMVDKTVPSVIDNKMAKVHYSKAFSTGKYGMLIVGEWAIGQIDKNVEGKYDFKYDIQVMPHPKGSKPTTWGTGSWYGINKRSSKEQKDLTWEFVKFLNGPEGAEYMATLNRMPAAPTPKAIELFKKSAPAFVSNINALFVNYNYCTEKPFGENSNIFNKIMQEESDLGLAGAKPLEKALQDAKERIQKEIAATKKKE